MASNAKAPAPVLVDLPCGMSSAWHSGTHVFPPEQHRRTPSSLATGVQQSTRGDRWLVGVARCRGQCRPKKEARSAALAW